MIEEPLLANELKDLLSSELTERLKDFGLLKSDGNYLWFGDFNEDGYRKVFHYCRLKGNCGTFRWGFCFRDIATITTSRTIRNHRTDKSVRLHLWDEPFNYLVPNEGPFIDYMFKGIMSQWGKSEFKRTFRDLWDHSYPAILFWFEKHKTNNDILEIIENQQKFGKNYHGRDPMVNYIKAFILCKVGRVDEGVKLIREIKSMYIKYDTRWNKPYDKIIEMLQMKK